MGTEQNSSEDIEKIPVGQFVDSKLEAEGRRVAHSRNDAGYARIYPDVARALVSEYPESTAEQRQAVFYKFKHHAELIKARTGLDVAAGLGEASKILGL